MKITVITVVWNNVEFIRDCIESVLNQNYSNIEYIIIDGGSSDGTLEVIKEYEDRISLSISEPDKGLYDAMNKAIGLSTGEVISILNSDDVFHDDRVISKVMKKFLKEDKLEVLLGGVNLVKRNNIDEIVRLYPAKRFKPWHLYFGIAPPHPGAFIKSSIYEKYGIYNTSFDLAADFDLFVRILLLNRNVYYAIDLKTVKMRIGGKSTLGFGANLKSSHEIYSSLKSHCLFASNTMIFCRFFIKGLKKFI